jgi:starch-binding outer membrane protein SusE/F
MIKNMKKILIFLPVILLAIIIAGCEKEGEKVVLKENITANVLSDLSASTFELLMDSAETVTETFDWTAVDFGFPAQITYTVQFDTTGNAFENAVDVVTVTSELSADVIEGELNKLLLQNGYKAAVPATLQFRIKAVVNSKVAPAYSDALEAIVIPYAIVFPPIYMCGDATGGWNWNSDVTVRSTAAGIYSTIAVFTNGGAFRFFKQADWGPTSYNYPYFTTVSALFENAADGDQNFRFTGTTGYYRVTVNMTTKTVTMESVAEPVLYATGGALGGWDWSTNYIQLTWLSDGVFEATTDFSADIFRFFKQAGWGDGYSYTYFNDGTVTPLLELNAGDSDNNFKFVGTPGTYKITVNLIDLIVTMEAI